MGDGMPYMMTKGPVWQFFDDWFSDPTLQVRLEHKIDALIAVHTSSGLFGASPGQGTTPVAKTNWPKVKDRNKPGVVETAMPDKHFDEWFDTKGQDFSNCAALIGKKPTTTGWWTGWGGDAEAIVREAFIRAIEVSLGLDHHPWSAKQTEAAVRSAYGGLPAELSSYPRNWAMDFAWVCPLPMLRASVRWRRLGAKEPDGLASLTFMTPGMTGPWAQLAWSLDKVPVPGGAPKWARPASNAIQANDSGSWIVGQVDTVETDTTPACAGTESTDVPTDAPEKYSCGPLMTVAPEVHDGGVK
jgi:hypothetical protein